MNTAEKGSQIAKNGFKNEAEVVGKFNNWKNDNEAKEWLIIMKYKLAEIEFVKAIVVHGYKADINLQVQIKLKKAIDIENIQVKLVSQKRGFNQIDKRWLDNYQKLWNMPENILNILKYFTGEQKPYKPTKDKRRMLFNEMNEEEKQIILDWFKQNKVLILSDIIKGRGEFAAEWMLVAQQIQNNAKWVLKNINEVLNFYAQGEVQFSQRGSLNIGQVGMQRKGGDGGRSTANMLQFKIDPTKLFEN